MDISSIFAYKKDSPQPADEFGKNAEHAIFKNIFLSMSINSICSTTSCFLSLKLVRNYEY